MILLDTNIIVDYLRNYGPAVKFFRAISKDEEILFSAITESELLTGSANNDNVAREKLLHFLNNMTKVSLNNPVAMFAGDIRRENGLSLPDAIIAATALAHNAELMTRNVKDFRNVPELRVRSPYS